MSDHQSKKDAKSRKEKPSNNKNIDSGKAAPPPVEQEAEENLEEENDAGFDFQEEGGEEEDLGENEEEGGEEDGEFADGSLRASAPAPTPQLEEFSEDELRPMGMNELKVSLESALERLTSMTSSEFLDSLKNKSDIHSQAVLSAKQIAKDFVEKAADLAASMQMILQYDQLMLRKLDLTTAYDFGVKPKTDEETRAIMIDRAQRMLKLGQMQYEMSHKISNTAKPLIDYRFEACDDFNAVQEKISIIREKEAERTKRLAIEEDAARLAALNRPPVTPPLAPDEDASQGPPVAALVSPAHPPPPTEVAAPVTANAP